MKKFLTISFITFSSFGFVSCSEVEKNVSAVDNISGAKANDFKREVWQLIEIDETAWAEIKSKYPILSEDIKQSIVQQFKLVTWFSEGEIKMESVWLDCNIPKIERRRVVVTPGRTIEHNHEDGSVSYTHTPAILESVDVIVRNNEGCSPHPPTDNILTHHVEGSF